MVRTCSNTESPCTLSAAQQSRLPHRPVREARSQPEQTSSRMEQSVPAPAGKSRPLPPGASIREKEDKPTELAVCYGGIGQDPIQPRRVQGMLALQIPV